MGSGFHGVRAILDTGVSTVRSFENENESNFGYAHER